MYIVKTHQCHSPLLQNPLNQECSNLTVTPNFEHINLAKSLQAPWTYFWLIQPMCQMQPMQLESVIDDVVVVGICFSNQIDN